MADCVFCQILEGRAEGSVVYRDERAIVLLDLFPVREAHCLVIPVQHQPLLQDLEPDLCAHLFELARRTIRAHKRAGLDVLAHNVIDGREANQHVPHVHVHVIPRRGGDTLATALTWGTRMMNIFGLAKRRRRLDRLAGLLAEHFPES